MLPTFLGGVIALIVAIGFLSILLAAVPSIPLWIVVVIGILLMIASVVEAVRQGEEQFGGSNEERPVI